MDYVLDYVDEKFFTPYVYPETFEPDNIMRQFLTLFIITNLGGALLYLSTATFSYYFIFDHKIRKHPKFLKDQERLEIQCALTAVPGMALPTVLLFVAEVRGHTLLYDKYSEYGGVPFLLFSCLSFIMFTDFFIYWIHRYLHHPLIYKHLHKDHHKWKVPTPFASHAFHPIDGFLQSLPYHVYPFIFPLWKPLYLGLFLFVNIWTVSIHDADFRVPKFLQPIINGCAHHSDHHLLFEVNYGEYFTFWDRLFGSFHYPEHYAGTGVHDTIREIERKEAAAAGKSNGASSPSSAATTSTSQMVTRSAKKRAPAAGRD